MIFSRKIVQHKIQTDTRTEFDILEHMIHIIIQELKKQQKIQLAETFEKFYTTSIANYSQILHAHTPGVAIEQELLESFKEEMQERNMSQEDIAKTLTALTHSRVLQTAPHTALVPNARMFCIDWLTTRGLINNTPYIVCSFSGVPFSNSSKSGRIKSERTTLNFVPSRYQDTLVYSAPIFSEATKLYQDNQWSLAHIPNPTSYIRFSDWACDTSQTLHRATIYPHTVYLDINKIITKYLLKIISKETHPIYKLLFDQSTRTVFENNFGKDIHLFHSKYTSKKYVKQESVFFDGYTLKGNHTQINLTPEEIREGLINLTLCPAPIIVFTILTFLNDCKCLGSFFQIEYLSDFQEKWKETGFIQGVEKRSTKNLTTGQFPDFTGNAFDFLTEPFEPPNPNTTTMKTLWEPLYSILIKQ